MNINKYTMLDEDNGALEVSAESSAINFNKFNAASAVEELNFINHVLTNIEESDTSEIIDKNSSSLFLSVSNVETCLSNVAIEAVTSDPSSANILYSENVTAYSLNNEVSHISSDVQNCSECEPLCAFDNKGHLCQNSVSIDKNEYKFSSSISDLTNSINVDSASHNESFNIAEIVNSIINNLSNESNSSAGFKIKDIQSLSQDSFTSEICIKNVNNCKGAIIDAYSPVNDVTTSISSNEGSCVDSQKSCDSNSSNADYVFSSGIDLSLVKKEPAEQATDDNQFLKDCLFDPAEEFHIKDEGYFDVDKLKSEFADKIETEKKLHINIKTEVSSDRECYSHTVDTPKVRFKVNKLKKLYSKEELHAAYIMAQSTLSLVLNMNMFTNIGVAFPVVYLYKLQHLANNNNYLMLEDATVLKLFCKNYGTSIKEWSKFWNMNSSSYTKRKYTRTPLPKNKVKKVEVAVSNSDSKYLNNKEIINKNQGSGHSEKNKINCRVIVKKLSEKSLCKILYNNEVNKMKSKSGLKKRNLNKICNSSIKSSQLSKENKVTKPALVETKFSNEEKSVQNNVYADFDSSCIQESNLSFSKIDEINVGNDNYEIKISHAVTDANDIGILKDKDNSLSSIVENCTLQQLDCLEFNDILKVNTEQDENITSKKDQGSNISYCDVQKLKDETENLSFMHLKLNAKSTAEKVINETDVRTESSNLQDMKLDYMKSLFSEIKETKDIINEADTRTSSYNLKDKKINCISSIYNDNGCDNLESLFSLYGLRSCYIQLDNILYLKEYKKKVKKLLDIYKKRKCRKKTPSFCSKPINIEKKFEDEVDLTSHNIDTKNNLQKVSFNCDAECLEKEFFAATNTSETKAIVESTSEYGVNESCFSKNCIENFETPVLVNKSGENSVKDNDCKKIKCLEQLENEYSNKGSKTHYLKEETLQNFNNNEIPKSEIKGVKCSMKSCLDKELTGILHSSKNKPSKNAKKGTSKMSSVGTTDSKACNCSEKVANTNNSCNDDHENKSSQMPLLKMSASFSCPKTYSEWKREKIASQKYQETLKKEVPVIEGWSIKKSDQHTRLEVDASTCITSSTVHASQSSINFVETNKLNDCNINQFEQFSENTGKINVIEPITIDDLSKPSTKIDRKEANSLKIQSPAISKAVKRMESSDIQTCSATQLHDCFRDMDKKELHRNYKKLRWYYYKAKKSLHDESMVNSDLKRKYYKDYEKKRNEYCKLKRFLFEKSKLQNTEKDGADIDNKKNVLSKSISSNFIKNDDIKSNCDNNSDIHAYENCSLNESYFDCATSTGENSDSDVPYSPSNSPLLIEELVPSNNCEVSTKHSTKSSHSHQESKNENAVPVSDSIKFSNAPVICSNTNSHSGVISENESTIFKKTAIFDNTRIIVPENYHESTSLSIAKVSNRELTLPVYDKDSQESVEVSNIELTDCDKQNAGKGGSGSLERPSISEVFKAGVCASDKPGLIEQLNSLCNETILENNECAKKLFNEDELLNSISEVDQQTELEIIFSNVGTSYSRASAFKRDAVPDYYGKVPLAQPVLVKQASVPLVGLQYIIEVKVSIVTVFEECYYVCSICNKKMSPSTLVAHIKSVPHRLKFVELHCFDLDKKYGSVELKNWNAALVKEFTSDLEEVEKQMGKHRMAVCLETQLPIVLSSLKEKIQSIPSSRNVHRSGEDLRKLISKTGTNVRPIHSRSPEIVNLLNSPQSLTKRRSRSSERFSRDFYSRQSAPLKDSSLQKGFDHYRVTSPRHRGDCSGKNSSPPSRNSGRSRSPPYRRSSPYRRGSPPFRRGSPPFRRGSPPQRRISPHRRSSPLHRRGSPSYRRGSPSSRVSPRHRSPSPVHRSRSPYSRDSKRNGSPFSRSQSWSRSPRRHNTRHRSPALENYSSAERERRKKIEEFRFEEEKLKAYCRNSRVPFEREPHRHPSYNREWKKYWNRRTRDVESQGYDPLAFNYKSEWLSFWQVRMDELDQEYYRSRRNLLLQQFEIEDPDIPLKSAGVEPPLGWVVGQKPEGPRACSPWEKDSNFPLKNPSPPLPSLSNNPTVSDVIALAGKTCAKFNVNLNIPEISKENEFSVLETLKRLDELEDQLGLFAPAVNALLKKAIEFPREKDIFELFKSDDNLVLIKLVREKLSSQVTSGVLSAMTSARTHMAIESAMWLQRTAERKNETSSDVFGLDIKHIAHATCGMDSVQIASYVADHLISVGKGDMSEVNLQKILLAVTAAHAKIILERSKLQSKTGVSEVSSGINLKPEHVLHGMGHSDSKLALFPSGTAAEHFPPVIKEDSKNEMDVELSEQDTCETHDSGLKLLQHAYVEDEPKKLESYSIEELQDMLLNFNSLNQEDQKALTAYLKKLEATDSKKVTKLRESVYRSSKSSLKQPKVASTKMQQSTNEQAPEANSPTQFPSHTEMNETVDNSVVETPEEGETCENTGKISLGETFLQISKLPNSTNTLNTNKFASSEGLSIKLNPSASPSGLYSGNHDHCFKAFADEHNIASHSQLSDLLYDNYNKLHVPGKVVDSGCDPKNECKQEKHDYYEGRNVNVKCEDRSSMEASYGSYQHSAYKDTREEKFGASESSNYAQQEYQKFRSDSCSSNWRPETYKASPGSDQPFTDTTYRNNRSEDYQYGHDWNYDEPSNYGHCINIRSHSGPACRSERGQSNWSYPSRN